MISLFIGRFQPFHNGHLEIIKNISKKYDKIIIGIGSSQYKNTIDNPFSFSERKEMINRTLKKYNIDNYKIILIPDIHNPPKWVNHILSIYSDFDVVIANNSFTKKLFIEKKIPVENTPHYDRRNFKGEVIRKRIINNKKWDHLVPKTVYDFIIEIDGIKRLQNINKN